MKRKQKFKEFFIKNNKRILKILANDIPIKEQLLLDGFDFKYREYLYFLNRYFKEEYLMMRIRIMCKKKKNKITIFLSSYRNDLYSTYLRLIEDEELSDGAKDIDFDNFKKAWSKCEKV